MRILIWQNHILDIMYLKILEKKLICHQVFHSKQNYDTLQLNFMLQRVMS
jgi:hypothetical protein